MKKFNLSRLILLGGAFMLPLTSCGIENVASSSQISEANPSTNIIFSSDIEFDGLTGKETVSNSVTTFNFNEKIEVSQGARWVLSKDIYGSETILTKIAPLNEGDNTYYIIVTSGDETNIDVYTIIVRRKPMYTVTFDTNGGTSVSSISIEEGETISNEYTTSKDGYTFDGWYIDNVKLESEYQIMSDTELEAKYTANTYAVTMDTTDCTYTGESTYEVTYGESFTFPVASWNVDASKVYTTATFKGWKYKGTLVTDSDGKLLNNWDIDAENITLTPEFDSDDIYFGLYPQTDVTSTKGSELSKAYPFNSSTWTDYGYYIEGNVKSYMYYYDIDIDSNGSYDYRGVYFTKYRPCSTTDSSSSDDSYQDNNGYTTNKIYWFSYDPIKWNILESKNGKALITSELILDSQDYNYTRSSTTIDDNTVYSNNYMYSHIRSWLNDTFYNTAFNDLEKSIIQTTEVDNSASSTNSSSNSFACANTNDKIFLLSYQEANTYYTSDFARQAKTTAYAQCQGACTSANSSYLGNGYWWLRSPSDYYDHCAYLVDSGGRIRYINVYRTYYGVRVACWINL